MMRSYLSSNTLALLLLTNLVALPASLSQIDDWCANVDNSNDPDFFDYIVVGAGPGGGLVASRLAQAGFKTLLLDAGPDYGEEPVITNPASWPQSTEDPNVEWAVRVKFSDDPGRESVLYPRASMLGGCATHNAMIGQYSFPDFWEGLRVLTGDEEFAEDKMRDRFERIEKNEYVKEGSKASKGHGFDGFLSTSYGINIIGTIFRSPIGKLLGFIGDVIAPGAGTEEGLYAVPTTVSTSGGQERSSVYNLIKETMSETNTLTVRPNSFVTKVLLEENDDDVPVAYGVQVKEGRALYEASTGTKVEGAMQTYFARKEVIVAGGIFNTPQILMLSGIGPASELGNFGIPVVLDSPGVGSNLQDKLESTVNYDLTGFSSESTKLRSTPEDFFSHRDNISAKQVAGGAAGSLLGIQHKSDSKLEAADIHVNLFFADLQGMNDGWVDTITDSAGIFTFNIITAPPGSRTGKVSLLSDDPFDVVDIDFNGYDDDDLTKSAEAIRWVRKLAKTLGPLFSHEFVPGTDVKSEEDLKAFVSRTGWGHHGIGTAKMGADSDPMAVVDGQFRVRGVESLRVADASVLPNHPGFYVMIPLYMLAEKAAEDIIKDDVTIGSSSFSNCWLR